MINTKDWARKIATKLPTENKDAFEQYLISNATFAEAATELIEELLDAPELDKKLATILKRVEAGEDAEAVVHEECE